MFMEPPPASLAPKLLNRAMVTIGKKEQFRFGFYLNHRIVDASMLTHKEDKMFWPSYLTKTVTKVHNYRRSSEINNNYNIGNNSKIFLTYLSINELCIR